MFCKQTFTLKGNLFELKSANTFYFLSFSGMVLRRLQVQGTFPGEQLQHLRLGDPQEPKDRSGVVCCPQ